MDFTAARALSGARALLVGCGAVFALLSVGCGDGFGHQQIADTALLSPQQLGDGWIEEEVARSAPLPGDPPAFTEDCPTRARSEAQFARPAEPGGSVTQTVYRLAQPANCILDRLTEEGAAWRLSRPFPTCPLNVLTQVSDVEPWVQSYVLAKSTITHLTIPPGGADAATREEIVTAACQQLLRADPLD